MTDTKQQTTTAPRWQIRDQAGRALCDYVSHPIAIEMLSVFQHHAIPVTLRLVQGGA
ncbi:hypothetical protein OVY01_13505 [Robbsia sp. Bb-Pol-6]|uniref:Uncharacterized protein n=1 Tax=Robbsia betulipollinis TaxID=2981849 RepID=A0ABT3ZQM5_9BURK|nr:hypothetical protein [Robbsia betulipollinis]MCY0388235.1 hypothetical protein [Robbsia betulipollinis]